MRIRTLPIVISAAVGLWALPASAQLFDNIAAEHSAAKPQTPGVAAQSPVRHADDGTALLASYIDGSQSLSGQFEQFAFSNRGSESSSGSFRLKRPGMFDWQYSAPNAQRIISDGTKVYHYDQDLEQITVRPRSELAGDVAMNLLVGDQRLQQAFSVREQPVSEVPQRLRSDEPGLKFFELKPKNRSDEVDQVWVVLRDEAIAAVYVDTGVGQQSLIILHNIKRNAPIAATEFNFIPPAGVDVIGG